MRNSSRRIGFVSPRQLFRAFVEARFRRDWHSLQSEMMISSSPRLTESRPAHRKSAHRESIASNTPSPGTHSHSSRQSFQLRRNPFAYPHMAKEKVTKKVRGLPDTTSVVTLLDLQTCTKFLMTSCCRSVQPLKSHRKASEVLVPRFFAGAEEEDEEGPSCHRPSSCAVLPWCRQSSVPTLLMNPRGIEM